jgi:predicted GNAT family N-acyltransferase
VKPAYTMRLSDSEGATLDVMDFTVRRHKLITRLIVPLQYRLQGVGTALMEQACADADAEDVTLVLSADPYRDGPFSRRQLEKWYERFGFRKVPSGYMYRNPGAPRSSYSGGAGLRAAFYDPRR